jgi:hypothetical protein
LFLYFFTDFVFLFDLKGGVDVMTALAMELEVPDAPPEIVNNNKHDVDALEEGGGGAVKERSTDDEADYNRVFICWFSFFIIIIIL